MGLFSGIFGKKFPPRENVDGGDGWFLGAGRWESGPTVMRVRKSAKPLIGHPEFPVLFSVGVVIKDPDANGFHNAVEGAEIGIIEDLVCGAVERDHLGVFVATRVCQGVKNFIFYATSGDAATERVKAVPEFADTDREFRLGVENDPDWKTFKNILALMRL